MEEIKIEKDNLMEKEEPKKNYKFEYVNSDGTISRFENQEQLAAHRAEQRESNLN